MASIGNYDILETISQTGPSTVYLAIHQKLNRKTLLKVYRGGDPKLIDRFEREARIVADLNSDYIVQVYDFGEIDGQFYISMEYVDGQNLQEFLASHRLSGDELMEFSFQIARAVSVLHLKGYIHRDLKPENILVSKDKKIKLTDFGISLHRSLKRITSEGALLGTPLYMSPEQINNLPLTAACDVFALGIIFYQMAAGKHPFESEQYGEVFAHILTTEPPELCRVRPDLPQWYCDMVTRALQKDAGQRIPDAMTLMQIIQQNMPEQFGDIPFPKTPGRRNPARMLIAVFVLLAVLSTAWLIRHRVWLTPQPPAPVDTTFSPNQTEDSAKQVIKPDTNRLAHAPTNDQPTNHQQSEDRSTATPKPADQIKPDNRPTTLFVRTYPWCNIYLNYKLIDQTPMAEAIKIKPGRYVLGLQNPSYPSFTDTIEIRPHQQNKLFYNLDSIFVRVDLNVIPWGKVYIDGKYIGTTPIKSPIYVTRDFHVLEIQNKYYQSWIDTLDTRNEMVIKRSIQLKEKL